MTCKNDSTIRDVFRRSAAALAAAALIIASAAQPACKAAALEITASVAISALVAYLGASGITYSADGGDTADIISSIQKQISPYINQQYGSEEAWLNDMRALSSPLGTLNGGLSISKPLCDIFEDVRSWIVSNVFNQTDSVTVDHIAGADIGTYTAYVNGSDYGTISVTTSVGDTWIGTDRVHPASWLGTGCYLTIPASNFGIGQTTVRLSAMPGQQTIYMSLINNGKEITYQIREPDSQSIMTGSFWIYGYVYIGLGRQVKTNGALQPGKYALYMGSANNVNDNSVTTYALSGDLSVITTPNYTLSSDYNMSVSAPVVQEGNSLVIDTGGDLISGVDSKLDDVLVGVQAGTAVYPDSRVDADAANVAPAVYSAGEDYALDLTSFFPFCIPWDIDRGLRLFTAEPVTPSISWVVPLPDGSSYTLEIDLHDYDGVAALGRKLELILWVVGLAVATKYLIKW